MGLWSLVGLGTGPGCIGPVALVCPLCSRGTVLGEECLPQIHIHWEPQHVTFFGNTVLADEISNDEMVLIRAVYI